MRCLGSLVGSRGSGRRDDVEFRWTMKLDAKEEAELLRKKKVTKNIENITVTDKTNREQLWPNPNNEEWSGILVRVNEQSVLEIDLAKRRDGMPESILRCDDGGVRFGKAMKIFADGDIIDPENGRSKVGRLRVPTEIELTENCREIKDGKQLECDLKVVTGSDLEEWLT